MDAKLNPRDIIKANGTDRMDIFVRWMYVEAVLNNHSEEQIKRRGDLYCKMQQKRIGGGSTTSFNKLIESIKKDGYKENSIIHCSELISCSHCNKNTGYKLSGGAHRLACCLAFNFDTIPVKLSSIEEGTALSTDDYSLKWFKKHGFSKGEITLIKNFYNSKRHSISKFGESMKRFVK